MGDALELEQQVVAAQDALRDGYAMVAGGVDAVLAAVRQCRAAVASAPPAAPLKRPRLEAVAALAEAVKRAKADEVAHTGNKALHGALSRLSRAVEQPAPGEAASQQVARGASHGAPAADATAERGLTRAIALDLLYGGELTAAAELWDEAGLPRAELEPLLATFVALASALSGLSFGDNTRVRGRGEEEGPAAAPGASAEPCAGTGPGPVGGAGAAGASVGASSASPTTCVAAAPAAAAAVAAAAEAAAALDVTPALGWAEERRSALERIDSPLLFRLHRLRFLQLSCGGRTADAVSYAREHLAAFAAAGRHARDVSALMGSLVFPDGASLQVEARQTAALLRDEACMLAGLPARSPLRAALRAGALASGHLEKYLTLNAALRLPQHDKHQEHWADLSQMPVDVPLPADLTFHSVFICPVSKEPTTEENFPVLLRCGHVISNASLLRIIKPGGRVKCPTCLAEQFHLQSQPPVRVHF
jgi:hypothetical protein